MASIFCDNEAVQKSNSDQSQTLNRKHNSVCFHLAREAVAAGVARLGWIKGTENPADIFTKILDRVKRAKFVRMLIFNNVGCKSRKYIKRRRGRRFIVGS